MKLQQQTCGSSSMLMWDRQGSHWVCVLVPDIPGCPVTCERSPTTPVTSCDHFKQNIVYPSISQDCGENWYQGWGCGARKDWVPTVPRGRQGPALTFWLLHLGHRDVEVSVCYLFYDLLQFVFAVLIWHLQYFLMVLWEKAIMVGLSGYPSPLRSSSGWLPELKEGALHGSTDTYLHVPHHAVLSVQSSSAI